MPHISIKMLKGRTEEQKVKAAEAVTKALAEALGIGDFSSPPPLRILLPRSGRRSSRRKLPINPTRFIKSRITTRNPYYEKYQSPYRSNCGKGFFFIHPLFQEAAFLQD